MSKASRLALATAALTLSGAVHAAAVTITFDNPIFGGFTAGSGATHDNVSITYLKQSGAGSQTAGVAAGRFSGDATDLVGIESSIFVDGVDQVFMYCYDLYEGIRGGQVVRYTVNFDGPTDRTLDFLGAVNYVMHGNSNDWLDPYAWARPLNGLQGSAIQLGIWESRFDTSSAWSVGGGDFKASGLESKTKGWLDEFFAAIPLANSLDKRFAMTLENAGAQDMITADPPSRVPEPGSIALVAAGLASLLGLRRRRG